MTTKVDVKMIDNLISVEVGDFCWSARSSKAGWLICRGGTIGSATSGATALAGSQALALFTVLWDSHPNAVHPIQNSAGTATTRGASAAADFAANKRLPLPHSGGRGLIGTGQGSGLTNRTIGQTGGAETHTLTASEVPELTGSAEAAPDHTHGVGLDAEVEGEAEAGIGVTVNSYTLTGEGGSTGVDGGHGHDVTVNSGGGGAHNNMPPFLAENLFIFAGA